VAGGVRVQQRVGGHSAKVDRPGRLSSHHVSSAHQAAAISSAQTGSSPDRSVLTRTRAHPTHPRRCATPPAARHRLAHSDPLTSPSDVVRVHSVRKLDRLWPQAHHTHARVGSGSRRPCASPVRRWRRVVDSLSRRLRTAALEARGVLEGTSKRELRRDDVYHAKHGRFGHRVARAALPGARAKARSTIATRSACAPARAALRLRAPQRPLPTRLLDRHLAPHRH